MGHYKKPVFFVMFSKNVGVTVDINIYKKNHLEERQNERYVVISMEMLGG